MMPKLGFAFLLLPGLDERYAIMQARSIREFCGSRKSAPIFAMVPRDYCLDSQETVCREWKLISAQGKAELEALQVELVPFNYTPSLKEISYTAKTLAAGAAEAYAKGKVEQLIFSDSNMVYLNDPSLMLLPPRRLIGLRPVDIQNIGLQWDAPVNDFWAQIYRLFRIDSEQLFPVISTVTQVKLKTWLNCCLMTVRPSDGILQNWSAALLRYHNLPVWHQYTDNSELYRIFLHQAFFNGSLLASLSEDEIEIYPLQINFPLHFYPEHPHKPTYINELVCARFEFDGKDDCWKSWLPMREPLKSWLIHHGSNCLIP